MSVPLTTPRRARSLDDAVAPPTMVARVTLAGRGRRAAANRAAGGTVGLKRRDCFGLAARSVIRPDPGGIVMSVVW